MWFRTENRKHKQIIHFRQLKKSFVGLTQILFLSLEVVEHRHIVQSRDPQIPDLAHEGWISATLLPGGWMLTSAIVPPPPTPRIPPVQRWTCWWPHSTGTDTSSGLWGPGKGDLHDGWVLGIFLPCGWILRLWRKWV